MPLSVMTRLRVSQLNALDVCYTPRTLALRETGSSLKESHQLFSRRLINRFGGISSPFTSVPRQMRRSQVGLERKRLLRDMVEAAVGTVEEMTAQGLLPRAEMPACYALEVTGTHPILRVAPRDHSAHT